MSLATQATCRRSFIFHRRCNIAYTRYNVIYCYDERYRKRLITPPAVTISPITLTLDTSNTILPFTLGRFSFVSWNFLLVPCEYMVHPWLAEHNFGFVQVIFIERINHQSSIINRIISFTVLESFMNTFLKSSVKEDQYRTHHVSSYPFELLLYVPPRWIFHLEN